MQEYLNAQHQNRRSRMETLFDILTIIAAGAEKPTHIMYKANLSWTIMQQNMRLLESQGLVVPSDDEGRRVYHLSEKGFALLKQFQTIREGLMIENEMA